MKLTVYQVECSPYCIPVIAVLNACRVNYRVVEVPYNDRSAIIKLTKGKYYQVPFLLHGRRQIYERTSDTIDVARYLDRTFAKGRLFPKNQEGLQRILVPYIENEVEMTTFKLMMPRHTFGIRDLVDRTHNLRFRERRFGRGCLQKWLKEAPALRLEAQRLLEPFELLARRSPFLLGDAPVYTDYALYGVHGNLTYGGHEPFPKKLKALAEWQKRLRAWRFD